MSEKKKEEDPWKTALTVVAGVGAAAAAIGGLAYFISKASEESEVRSIQPPETALRPDIAPTVTYYPLRNSSSPFVTTKKAEPLDEQEKCVVCWGTMRQLRRLNCGHVFHHDCVTTWLEEKSTCPLCRQAQ